MSQTINVDITPNNFQPTLNYSQGDVGRTFSIKIVSQYGDTLPAGATVKIQATKPSGFGFDVTADSVTDNVATFTTTAEMTDEWGRFPAQLDVTKDAVTIFSAKFLMVGAKNTHPEGTTDGSQGTIIPELTLLVERVEAAASSVLDMEVEAQTLPAGSLATYSYDEALNKATFGIPQGEAGAGAAGVTASAYSASRTYAVGEYVIHNNNLYRCTTAITTAEAFTAAHWTQVVLSDDVSDLKSEISDLRMPYYGSGNIFFAEEGTWDGHYYNDSGSIASHPDYGYSNLMPVKASTNYVIVAPPVFWNFLREDGTFIDGWHSTSGTSTTIATPAGCAFLRISIPKANKDTCVIIEGTTVPTEYIAPKYQFNNVKTVSDAELLDIRKGEDNIIYPSAGDAVREQIAKVSEEITNINNDIGDLRTPYYGAGNIFFAERGTWDDHYYNDSGVLTPFTGYGYSELIPVKGGINYTIVAPPVFWNFYDAEKNFIDGYHANSGTSTSPATPANCAYMRISIPTANKDTCMIVEGATAPTSYIAPRYAIDNDKTVVPYLGTRRPINVYCIGDSLTEGVDYQSHVIKENYPYFLAKELNVNIVNYGKSGLTPKTWWDNWHTTLTFNKYTDVALIMFGSNAGIPDTLSTDVEPYNDWHDYADTICGCYCKLIEEIMEQSSNKAQIILMAPPHSTYSENQEYYVTTAHPVIMKIAKRYALPVIDILNESGISKFNSSYFQPHDGCHFNAKGYHKLGTFIASQLKSLFSEFDFSDVYEDETV